MSREPASMYRTQEQVLKDLGKALHFSAETLQVNRNGRLAAEQIQRLAIRCIRSAFLVSIFLFLPVFLWTAVTSAREQVSMFTAAPMVFNDLTHLSDSVEAHGKFGALFRLVSILVGLLMGLFLLYRFPFGLYFDIIDGSVFKRDGRIVAREEQTLRSNGRDPLEKYYFDMKTDRFEINLAAYRAIENGGMYTVYLLPRSQVLVALEPKKTTTAAAEPNAGVA